MPDRSPFKLPAVAVAADLHPDHPRPKRVIQVLGIARVTAEVCDNQGIVIVATINRRQRARPGTAELVLRQLLELGDPDQRGLKRPRTADHRGRAIMATPDIMGDNARLKHSPGTG